MPAIDTIGAIKIVIYFAEHGPPHFHAIGPGFEAKIAIEDGAVIAGGLPKRQRRQVRRWALANAALLVARWNEITNRS